MDAIVPTALGVTVAMPISTEMGVTAPTTAPTITAQMTQPEMGIFVLPFTVGVPVFTGVLASLNPHVRTRFDDRFINTHNSSRD